MTALISYHGFEFEYENFSQVKVLVHTNNTGCRNSCKNSLAIDPMEIFIFTSFHAFFNNIIQHGYGFAYLTYPFQFMDEFKALQEYAKSQNLGLWTSISF